MPARKYLPMVGWATQKILSKFANAEPSKFLLQLSTCHHLLGYHLLPCLGGAGCNWSFLVSAARNFCEHDPVRNVCRLRPELASQPSLPLLLRWPFTFCGGRSVLVAT